MYQKVAKGIKKHQLQVQHYKEKAEEQVQEYRNIKREKREINREVLNNREI